MVYLDRVEWLAISDSQTATNALLNGEIDVIEQPLIEHRVRPAAVHDHEGAPAPAAKGMDPAAEPDSVA